MALNEKLSKIQTQVKVGKNEYNSFSNFNYRTIDTILATIKPMLELDNLTIRLNDEITLVGERYYVKATATLTDGKEEISTTAYAREPLSKSKFDEPQVTGSASTYARKYALCGLFGIEGEQDPDSLEHEPPQPQTQKQTKKTAEKKVTEEQLEKLFQILDTPQKQQIFKTMLDEQGYKNSKDIPASKWTAIIKELNERLKANAEQQANIEDARKNAPF